MTEKTDKKIQTAGELFRQFGHALGKQIRAGFVEGMRKAQLEREANAKTAADPAPGLMDEEREKFERLLRTMPGRNRGDLPA